MTAPKLPPLPAPDIDKGLYDEDGYLESTVRAYALSAYQAGRDAGIEDAMNIVDASNDSCRYLMAKISALKSPAKEPL